MSQNEQMSYHQRIKLPYRYTAGPVHTAVLEGLAEGRLIGSVCPSCGLTQVPGRPFCHVCSSPTPETVEVEPVGEVVSFTVEGGGRIVGLIRIDGSSVPMAHVIDCDPETLAMGMRVAARWSPEPEAEITAIEAFVPV